jgi:hypothetical protein
MRLCLSLGIFLKSEHRIGVSFVKHSRVPRAGISAFAMEGKPSAIAKKTRELCWSREHLRADVPAVLQL